MIYVVVVSFIIALESSLSNVSLSSFFHYTLCYSYVDYLHSYLIAPQIFFHSPWESTLFDVVSLVRLVEALKIYNCTCFCN